MQTQTETRRVKRVHQSKATMEGAGVRLNRAIGFFEPPETYDPFLLLDDFRSDEPRDWQKGFPWHPHRGMETITYVLRGEVDHADSLGNSGTIGAGSGIVHQEMPRGDAKGAVYGFQLWSNLPAADKMMDPRYRGFTAEEIPEVRDPGGAVIKVIAGNVNGTLGAVRDVASGPEYLDVSIPAGATFSHPTQRGHTVFAYVFEGAGHFDERSDTLVGDRHLVAFEDGDGVTVRAGRSGVRFLLVSGKPIGEPIAWRGPIVMNTDAELRTAFEELQRGTFIKKQPR